MEGKQSTRTHRPTVPVLLVKQGRGDLLMSCDPHPSKSDRRTCETNCETVEQGLAELAECSGWGVEDFYVTSDV
nr:hypothetical protein [uncultured Roseateles sp.]